MSALADAARDYLQLRNSLGHDLAEHHRELHGTRARPASAAWPRVRHASGYESRIFRKP
jgi:hypothetical protein